MQEKKNVGKVSFKSKITEALNVSFFFFRTEPCRFDTKKKREKEYNINFFYDKVNVVRWSPLKYPLVDTSVDNLAGDCRS